MLINSKTNAVDRMRQIIPNSSLLSCLMIRVASFVLLCSGAIMSGCATSAVVKEAQGQIITVDKIAVLKITDAYKETNKGSVHICMEVRNLKNNVESEMTLNIPLQKQDRRRVHYPLNEGIDYIASSQLSEPFTGTYVGFQPMANDLTYNCQRQGDRLPVFNIGVLMSPFGSEASNKKSSLQLPNGMTEAVYTINQNGFPANFGYVSTSKFVSNSNSIDVQADSMLDMRTVRNQKPYLYLLTPVTVVVDAVTITAAVVVAALMDPNTYAGVVGMKIGNESGREIDY